MVSRLIRCGAEIRTRPGGRIDAEMDVLDVLQHHIHGDVAELDLRRPSVFPLRLDDQEDPLDLGPRPSATPYSAALITCSRAWTPAPAVRPDPLDRFVDPQGQIQ